MSKTSAGDYERKVPYWGEVPKPEMQRILETAREKGFRVALDMLGRTDPDLANYASKESRVDWIFHCYDEEHRERCLDIGSGWGSLSFPLTKFFAEVVSLEPVSVRRKFQEIRAKQEGKKNIRIIGADMLSLPFAENQFDLVVVNGVLEWAGHSRKCHPRTAQLSLLRDIRRCLRPGGCLYVGIENRYGWPYWLGARDHTSLPFTSILPRRGADLVVSAFLNTEGWVRYDTWTYSFWGYKSLLREAGFDTTDFYWTYPSYNDPMVAASLQNGDSYSFLGSYYRGHFREEPFFKRLASIIFDMLPSAALRRVCAAFWPTFLIFAWKSCKPETIQDAIAQETRAGTLVRISGMGHALSEITFVGIQKGRIQSLSKLPRYFRTQELDATRPERA